MSLVPYLEIISKQKWARRYKQHHPDVEGRDYKKWSARLKQLFTQLNGGVFNKTVVVDYGSGKSSRLNQFDKILIPMLIELGYTVSKESYTMGKASKEGTEVNIIDILNGMGAKFQNAERMKAALAKAPNPNLEKQIKVIEKIMNSDLYDVDDKKINIRKLSIYNTNKENQFKIVFSMDPRVIASQSTDVGWRSCMNLESGVYRAQVKSGIESGVFIAYLTRAGDELELKNPTSRVLLKPYTKLGDPDKYFWEVDKIYGTAPQSFSDQVKKIIKNIQGDPATGSYEMSSRIYNDALPARQYFIKSIEDLKGMDDWAAGKIIANQHPEWINLVSPAIQAKAVSYDNKLLSKVKNPSPRMIMAALDDNNIEAVKYLSDEQLDDIDVIGKVISIDEKNGTKILLRRLGDKLTLERILLASKDYSIILFDAIPRIPVPDFTPELMIKLLDRSIAESEFIEMLDWLKKVKINIWKFIVEPKHRNKIFSELCDISGKYAESLTWPPDVCVEFIAYLFRHKDEDVDSLAYIQLPTAIQRELLELARRGVKKYSSAGTRAHQILSINKDNLVTSIYKVVDQLETDEGWG